MHITEGKSKMSEENEKQSRNTLYVKMREIRLTQRETVGDQFRYVRGQGLIERNESVK